MIPEHNQSGVLPPFLPGSAPSNLGSMAPYKVSLLQVAQRFAVNEDRIKILEGFVGYRSALREVGFYSGFQWIDGSFVEKPELIYGRPPRDIDIITFSPRPEQFHDPKKWQDFMQTRLDLFDPEAIKKKYFCDAYFVDLLTHPLFLVNQTAYWFGLFSHQRETFLWKGMLEVPMTEEDADVCAFLEKGGAHVE